MDSNRSQPQLCPDPYQKQKTRAVYSWHWSATKIVLSSLSIVFCAVILGISINLTVDPAIQSYIAVWIAPQAGVALLWSAGGLITTYAARRSDRDIHPGAQAVVQLLLCLCFGVGAGLTAYVLNFALGFASFEDRDAYPQLHDYYYYDIGYEYYSDYYVRSMEAIIAFLALLIIIHFSLFARACVETARQKKKGMILVVRMSNLYPTPPLMKGF